MATQVQFRRGTTSQNNAFTGAVGELSVNTDLNRLRVHDGSTSGGYELANAASPDSGDYGSSTEIPVLTVNEQGIITSVGTASVAGVDTFTYDSDTQTLSIGLATGGSLDADISGLASEAYVTDNALRVYNSSGTQLYP